MNLFIGTILLIICIIAPFVVCDGDDTLPYRVVCCEGVRECCAEDHLCLVQAYENKQCGKKFRNFVRIKKIL